MVEFKKMLLTLLVFAAMHSYGNGKQALSEEDLKSLYDKAYTYKKVNADSVIHCLDSLNQYIDSIAETLLWHKSNLLYSEAYRKKGNYHKCLELAGKSLAFFENHGFEAEIAECNYLIGFCNSEFSNIEEASKYLNKSLHIYDSLNMAYEYYKTLNSVATNMFFVYNYKLASKLFKEIYNYAKTQNDTSFLAMSLNNLAVVYSSNENDNTQSDSALYFYNLSLETSESLKDTASIANTLMNMSLIYSNKKQYQEALNYLDRALVFSKQVDDRILNIYIYYNKGIIHRYQENADSSIFFLNIAENLAKKENYMALYSDIYKEKSLSYEFINDYKNAYENSTKSQYWKDTIWEQNLVQVTRDIELRYDTKQKANELNLKQALIEKQQSQLDNQRIRNMAIAILAFMFLTLLIVIYFYSNKLKKINLHLKQKNVLINDKNKALKETIESRDKLISIMAHDVKNPLATISGFAELIWHASADEFEETKNFGEHIYKSATSLNELLDNLLKWTKNQKKSIEISTKRLNLSELLEINYKLFEHTASSKNVEIKIECDPKIFIEADKQSIQTVFRNIISNALKFTDSGGNIHIKASLNNNFVVLAIKDSGIGIKKEDLNKLFDRNTNRNKIGSDKNKGFGLGLLLCDEFIKLNKGKIIVESEFGNGTTFLIHIPKSFNN